MSKRRLKPDELELWRKVTEKAKPLGIRFERKRDEDHFPEKTVKPATREIKALPSTRPLGSVETPSHDVLPTISESIANAPLKMDRKAFNRLKRGKLKPEAKLDLHGMTVDRAHSALSRFILSSHAKGRRLVLVITGKGKDRDEGGPIPVRLGVLRHQVPQWLALPPLAASVLQVSEAHLRHGGGGAFYVYLRKQR